MQFKWFLGYAGLLLFSSCSHGQEFAIGRFNMVSTVETSASGTYSVSGRLDAMPREVMNSGVYALKGSVLNLLPESGLVDAGLLANGGLNDLAGTFLSVRQDGGMSLEAGSVIIPGWTTLNAELAWVTNKSFGLEVPESVAGGFLLDLTGYRDNTPYGGITQTVLTTPGKAYRLSFALGAYQLNSRFKGPVSVIASTGIVTNSFTFTPPAFGTVGSVWQRFSWDFTATGSETPIAIVGTDAAGGGYLGLADIQLTASSEFTISLVSVSATGLSLSFISQPGTTYVLETAEELTGTGWGAVPNSEVAGNGKKLEFSLKNERTKRSQFYRIKSSR